MPSEAVVRVVDHNEGRGVITQRRRPARTGELSPALGRGCAGTERP